jgi:hypothetical protein
VVVIEDEALKVSTDAIVDNLLSPPVVGGTRLGDGGKSFKLGSIKFDLRVELELALRCGSSGTDS